MNDLRVLFISRKHPPSVGGMQQLSFHLVQNVSRMPGVRARAIVWGHGQQFLPLFAVAAFVRALWACIRGVDVVHVGDPVLCWLGLILRKLFRVPVAITVHGLDLTFPMPLYQAMVANCVGRYDRVICISRFAQELSLERAVPSDRCVIIPPGTEMPEMAGPKGESRKVLAQHAKRDWSRAKLLLTVGRLVPRKGVFFFVDRVLPQLVECDPSFAYVVVGQGPDRDRILQAVQARALQEHVFLTGTLSAELLRHTYNACDLFVAPNVPQPNDGEGFGLVVLEAAAAGCPVLVSDIEGLRDTIPANAGARFVPAGSPEVWRREILALFAEPGHLVRAGSAAQTHVANHCTWGVMAEKYVAEFRRLTERPRA